MRQHPKQHEFLTAIVRVTGSARFAQAITLTSIGMAYLSFALRGTIGWAGLIGIVSGLVVLAAASITVKRQELEWQGLLPISLLVFVGWSALSVTWSEYQWASLGAILYQLAFAFLGVFIALTRDMIQIVRAFGDVLRGILVVSLTLEIFAGLLIDGPIPFLGILGGLDRGGPIQGVLGSRNQLGLVALIALITFFVEYRTRSVQRPVAVWSMALAAATIAFTRSPVTAALVVVVALAAAALFALRRVEPHNRRLSQFVVLTAVLVGLLVAFLARARILTSLNAGGDFEVRLGLWRSILQFTPTNSLEGYGWLGYWRSSLPPYIGIDPFGPEHRSALNAFLDAWLQLGLIGLVSLIALVGLALVRSWLLASNKRSVIYLWPALILVALISVSVAESSILVEFGWLTLVVCIVKASQELSWRLLLPEHPER